MWPLRANIDRAINSVDVLERLAVHFQRERPTRVQIAYLQATDILFHKAWIWRGRSRVRRNITRHEIVKKFFCRVDQMINRVFGLHSSTSQRSRSGDKTRTLRLICSDMDTVSALDACSSTICCASGAGYRPGGL